MPSLRALVVAVQVAHVLAAGLPYRRRGGFGGGYSLNALTPGEREGVTGAGLSLEQLASQRLPEYDDSPCEQWTGLPPNDSVAEAPMKCGVLWYLHVPKTGGTTVMHHFHDNHERYNWRYANLWKLQIPPREKGPPGSPYHWAAWNHSKKWTDVVLKEIAEPQPRLIVHAHHNMPGLDDPYMWNGVLMPMKRSLEAKGCELRLATALREPVAEVVSLMLFRQIPAADFVPKMEENSDAMTKYVLYNYHLQWPVEYQGLPANDAQGIKLLQKGREMLSKFSLVGQTENLNSFIRYINLALGWPASETPAPWVTGTMNGQRALSGFVPYRPTPDMLQRVKQANVVDSLLYHTFCAKGSSTPPKAPAPVGGVAAQATANAHLMQPPQTPSKLDAFLSKQPPTPGEQQPYGEQANSWNSRLEAKAQEQAYGQEGYAKLQASFAQKKPPNIRQSEQAAQRQKAMDAAIDAVASGGQQQQAQVAPASSCGRGAEEPCS